MAKNPFDPNYAPYGTYEGERGNPSQWRSAYEARIGVEDAEDILSDHGSGMNFDNAARNELEISPSVDLTEAVIKAAYRKRVFQTHPDHGGTDEAFKRVQAAYSLLMDRLPS